MIVLRIQQVTMLQHRNIATNDLQMERNLTGGLPVVYQGHLANLGPFGERLTPAHEKKQEGCAGACRSVGLQNGQREKCSDAWDEHVCKWDAHDDMIWDAWHEQNAKRKTKPDHGGNIITHSRKWQELELQIWKVTSGVLQQELIYHEIVEAKP